MGGVRGGGVPVSLRLARKRRRGLAGRKSPAHAVYDAVGELNLAHRFAEFDALGCTGWVGCEYRPRGRTEERLDWLRLRPYRSAPAG